MKSIKCPVCGLVYEQRPDGICPVCKTPEKQKRQTGKKESKED